MYVAHPDSLDVVYDMALLETGSRKEAERAINAMLREADKAGMRVKISDNLSKKLARLI